MFITEHSPHNYEWLKVLLGTLAGLFTGLIAEPFKAALLWRMNVLRMHKSTALDMMTVATGLASVKNGVVTDEAFWRALVMPAYEHYWTTNREYLYDNLGLTRLRWLCQSVLNTKQNVETKHLSMTEGASRLNKIFDDFANDTPKSRFLNKVIQYIMRI